MRIRNLLILLVLACPEYLLAQTSGLLTGRVFDSSKAVIPDASITAKSASTGQQRKATTDASGRYVIADLPIGSYTVTAEKQGFQSNAVPSVVVGVAQSITVDFALATGVLAQNVTVSAEGQIINTEETAGATMDNRSLVDLPTNGRDFARYTLLTPGAVATTSILCNISFNGMQIVQNSFAIDGVDASRIDSSFIANGYERGARLLTGSLETIAEFRAQTSSYPAEYGRAAGGWVNIATKSGGNQVHGTLLEFLRNNAMDARNFFNTKPSTAAEFRFNDFGGNISGPIQKDKTFYFVNYEGSRQRVGITGSGTTPSDLLRSEVLSTSPVLMPILNEFPLGTSPTSNPLVNNYTTTADSDVREDTASVKIDRTFSDKNSAFVRVNVNDSHVFGPAFGINSVSFSSALGLLDYQNVPIRVTNVAIHDQELFSPTFINEILVGVQRWGSVLISDNPYPLLTVTGLSIQPGTRGRSKGNNLSTQIGDSLSYVRGAHTTKWGVQLYRVQVDKRSLNTSTLTYTSIQDFINNSAYSASTTTGNPGGSTWAYQVGTFIQDSWRARSGITVDYGLRWDYSTPPFDPSGHQRNFDLSTLALAAPGTPLYNSNKKDFSPRLAVAWQLSPRFVIRTGYGIFYQANPLVVAAGDIPGNSLPGNTSLLRTLVPTLSYPLTPFLGLATTALPAVNGFTSYKPDTYAQQWNFTTETAITQNMAVSVAYVGNHALNLRRQENLNYINPVTGKRPIPNFSNVIMEDYNAR
ncbi:MAG: carboxypeptidase regulatory-like domain-containing protein, partial [Candidatus Sulfotelmatobacter sp.]